MGRIIIVSNRLPITIGRKEGELIYHPSAGGLATGLNSLESDKERIWIGWPGRAVDDEGERKLITQQFKKDGMVPVFLSLQELEDYYEGFSNKTIWPHFHYFTQYTRYNEQYWDSYVSVNEKFAAIIAEVVEEDDLVWVHDYQLMLVPGLLRKRFPGLSIGFFLHIPFPSYELFRTLPWRRQLLEGVLGADQIGFHTFGYMRHFLSASYRILGYEHDFGKINIAGRAVSVDAFPMGIDYDKYAHPIHPENENEEVQFIKDYSQRRRIIISIDRLDYSKGIPERIRAYESFLKKYPDYARDVSLVLVVVPSRAGVDQYQTLKEEIDTLVGRINGEYGTFDWVPIRYYYRSFSFDSLCTLYRCAAIALITPLRDGMNLVAKEFVASKEDNPIGVLILSEMAGAASELQEALIINPNDNAEIVAALVQALDMPVEEQTTRLREMQRKLKRYNVKHWANNFIHQQMETKRIQEDRQTKVLSDSTRKQLLLDYQQAKSRLLLLDYDGTLVGFHPVPEQASPDPGLIASIQKLNAHKNTSVVIISGRDRYTLGSWFGDVGIEMVSEHGAWIWKKGEWQLNSNVVANWKSTVKPILENLVERTPGSFIEEKDYTLAWHYRRIDNELGANRVREIRDELIYLTANHNLQVLEGNKVVEVRNAGVDKGKAAGLWLNRQEWDFIMAIGDDHTDEDTFNAMPEHAYTIKVGLNKTAAKYKVRSVEEARELIDQIAAS
ncbi:MAG: bifunctional alpha,alpha-trehalose-phosphate synthase (UDP-forming)/trehalose-phosphatase [Bacteroidia bacterium]|nr:bifunctional alpha,alpha-trehalose-phosphate synthase (UDP-forming)/trehalose-phosphatase [Bacteroidia bacterium]